VGGGVVCGKKEIFVKIKIKYYKLIIGEKK